MGKNGENGKKREKGRERMGIEKEKGIKIKDEYTFLFFFLFSCMLSVGILCALSCVRGPVLLKSFPESCLFFFLATIGKH